MASEMMKLSRRMGPDYAKSFSSNGILCYIKWRPTIDILGKKKETFWKMTKKQSNSRRPKAKLTQNNASTTTWHTECTNECILAITLISLLPGGSDGKASVCNAGDPGSIPGLGGSPGEGNGSPHQYSCLENPMDCGAW